MNNITEEYKLLKGMYYVRIQECNSNKKSECIF
jgi:hypothetical protein